MALIWLNEAQPASPTDVPMGRCAYGQMCLWADVPMGRCACGQMCLWARACAGGGARDDGSDWLMAPHRATRCPENDWFPRVLPSIARRNPRPGALSRVHRPAQAGGAFPAL